MIYLSNTPYGEGLPVKRLPAGTTSADLPHGALNYDENQYFRVAGVNNGVEGSKSPPAGAFTFTLDRDGFGTIPPYDNTYPPVLGPGVIQKPGNGFLYFTYNLNEFALDPDNNNQDFSWTLVGTNLWSATIDGNGVLRARGPTGTWYVIASVSDGEFATTDTIIVILGYELSGIVRKPFVDPGEPGSGLEGAVITATRTSNGQSVTATTNSSGYYRMIIPWSAGTGGTVITMTHPYSDNYADSTFLLVGTNVYRTKNIIAQPAITNQLIFHLANGTNGGVYWPGSKYPLLVDLSAYPNDFERAAVISLFQHLFNAFNSLAPSQGFPLMNLSDYFTFTPTPNPNADIKCFRSNTWGAGWDNDVNACMTKGYIWTNTADYRYDVPGTWTATGFNSGTEEVLTVFGGFTDLPYGIPGSPWGGQSDNRVPVHPLEALNVFLEAFSAKLGSSYIPDLDNFSEQTTGQSWAR